MKFSKIIFISSVAVYGNHADVISNNSCYNNPGTYGLSKLSQEFLIKSCKNYTIIRPTYLYGNGMNRNSLLPAWVKKARQENKILVYGDGSRKQDYLHVDDLSELCWLASGHNANNTIIAATGSSLTNLQLAKKISEFIEGIEIEHTGIDASPSFSYDISAETAIYEWKPTVDFNIGLKNYIYNENFDI